MGNRIEGFGEKLGQFDSVGVFLSVFCLIVVHVIGVYSSFCLIAFSMSNQVVDVFICEFDTITVFSHFAVTCFIILWMQMLLILTKSVNRCFEKNSKFDMTPLLGGTDCVSSSLIHSFSWFVPLPVCHLVLSL